MAVISSNDLPFGPIQGKKVNCQQWASWEVAHSSEAANLCHGGKFQDDWYQPCQSRTECKAATQNRIAEEQGRRHLPVMNPGSYGGTRVLASSPHFSNAQTTVPQQRPDYTRFGPARPQSTPAAAQYLPMVSVPPPTYPLAVQTPFAVPMAPFIGGVTPTFLPDAEESMFGRLMKNAAQGAVGAVGYHVWDFARVVDFFGKRKP